MAGSLPAPATPKIRARLIYFRTLFCFFLANDSHVVPEKLGRLWGNGPGANIFEVEIFCFCDTHDGSHLDPVYVI